VAADIQRYAPQVALKMHLFRGASSPDVRRPRQRRDVEELIAALTAPDDEIRQSAARALGESKDAHAIDPLIAALQDPVHGVREVAAYALGKFGDARAVEPLLQELGTDLDLIAIAALQSVLVRIGDAQAVEFLRAFQHKLAEGDPRRGTVALLLVQVQSSR
jgi:HEAT repeat protein